MTTQNLPGTSGMRPLRFGHDSPEFARVVNLSDGVFAIALTLMVLGLDAPAVPAEQLAGALLDEAPQLVVFALSFGLVANIWWVHHRFVAQLAVFERGLIALNLVMLGLVALVPFPTSLVGSAPTARAAVVVFLGAFCLLALVQLALLVRARTVDAWRRSLPAEVFPWLVAGWLGQAVGILIAMAVAMWLPLVALGIGAMTGAVSWILVGTFGPTAQREWV